MMASIITETPSKPWDYYRDMTRQLWDEARHAMMGEAGFANLGIDWPKKVMINYTWSLALNTQLKPIERHAVLYFIEQGLMPRDRQAIRMGSRPRVAQPAGGALPGLRLGGRSPPRPHWPRLVSEGIQEPAAKRSAYGDECWSRVLMNWDNWRQKGLTQHRNWWPELYREACKRWKIRPDPKVLGYSTSYQKVRADLKNLAGSS